uniref:Uncharacterized protein n=1 Tax=Rhizophora mucronata TaxID=61149 RepID=A0A2P2P3B0_RHIMU
MKISKTAILIQSTKNFCSGFFFSSPFNDFQYPQNIYIYGKDDDQ